jgi:peptide chain release factor 1
MRGKLSSTVLKTSTGSDTCAEFIQHANKKEAMKIITARVRDKYQSEADAEYSEYRKKTLGDGGRGQKIRTYNFIDSFIKDHRNQVRVNNPSSIMDKGEFNKFYE